MGGGRDGRKEGRKGRGKRKEGEREGRWKEGLAPRS